MQIALSRIRVPQKKAQILKRVRLLDLLHQNIHRKMTFVCASAGFGKTTLLVDFVNDVDAKICWYQVGANDDDFPTFFRYFLSSFQQVYPDLGKDLIELVNEPERINPISVALEFTNEAIDEIQDYTLLVLDDYHLVSQNNQIVTFIESVLENLPDQIRLLIGSRSVYGIPSAELYVREELSLISIDDLRFTTNELIDLSRQHFQIKLSDTMAQQIIENTEGWILAILLSLRGEHPTAVIPKLAGAKEQIYNYLREEILGCLNPELRQFILVTSLFTEFTEALCNYVLEIDNAAELINQLKDQNLFITSAETNQGLYYQYHQLFKEFLLIELHKEISLQEVYALHSRSAEYYTRNHFEDLAIDHLLMAGRKTDAAKLMDQVSIVYSASGRQTQLKDWYTQICDDPDVVNLAPHLIMNVARIYINLGELDEVLKLVNPIEPVFRKNHDSESLANVLVIKGLVYRFTGQYDLCFSVGDEIINLVKQENLDPHFMYQAERLKGMATHFLNRGAEAEQHIAVAVEGMRQLSEERQTDVMKHELIMTLADQGLFTIKTGNIFQAEKSFAEALEISRRLRGHQGDVAMSANNQAYLYYLQGNYAQAWKYYDQALDAGKTSGWRRIIVDIYNGRGDLLRDIHELDRAVSEYEMALEYKGEAQEDISFGDTHLGLAELERMRDNFNQALFHIREAAHWNADSIELPKYQLLTGNIYFSMGHLELAAEKLDNALQSYTRENHPSIDRALTLLQLAQLEYIENHQEKTIALIKRALADIAALGYDSIFIIHCKEHLIFLKKIAPVMKNKQLNNIIEKASGFDVSFENIFSTLEEETPESLPVLQILGFGRGDVRLDGTLLAASSWKSVGARALFFYIINKGRVTKDDISLEFWPEFSQGKVNSNFHATLWRVRNALGHKEMISFDGEYYQLNSEVSYYYDVFEFEDRVKKFKQSNVSTTDRRDWGYQAISLYKDDFLIDIDMIWAHERRQELLQMATQIVGDMAEIEFTEGHYENARELYNKAISLDSYQDIFHVGLIKTLIAMGDRSSAISHINQYQQTLMDELGIELSPELVELIDLI
jgi:two-component SAPR family response regulator